MQIKTQSNRSVSVKRHARHVIQRHLSNGRVADVLLFVLGATQDAWMTSTLQLTALLESSTSARVYLRASGGLFKLVRALVEASPAGEPATEDSIQPLKTRGMPLNNTKHLNQVHFPRTHYVQISCASQSPILLADEVPHAALEPSPLRQEKQDARRSSTRRFSLHLSSVAAALAGGERLAQQEALHAGTLDACAKALPCSSEQQKVEDASG